MNSELLTSLASSPLFRTCDPKIVERVALQSDIKEFFAGDVIIEESTEIINLYLIIEGSVEVSKDGVFLSALYQGDFFGEMSMWNRCQREAQVIATSKVKLFIISERIFQEYLKPNTTILQHIIETYDARLRKHNSLIVKQFLELKHKYNELEESHQRLLQSDKLASIGLMTSSVAHEINNPLAVVLCYTHLMKNVIAKEGCQGTNLTPYLENIITASKSIGTIVNNIRSYIRSDEVKNSEIDIVNAIQLSLDLVCYLYKKEGITLEIDRPTTPYYILGNVGHIQQIFMNLLSNARDALEHSHEKKISITFQQKDDFVLLHVADTGHGMSEENKSKIFQKFFSTKEVGKGTGLGLDIVLGLLNKMNAQIEVHSTLNVGSTFTIKFPLVRAV